MLKPKVLGDDLPGFEVPSEEKSAENESQGGKKKKKGSGGFQSMGFSFPVIKGINKRGYKQPTPIQRKTIPLALQGKDVVAMARTGSGKTASFVLPILEKLTSPASKPMPGKNFRALILSPTRELALQTLKFVRELGKFTGLTSAAILGGESIEQQFSVMSGTAPDIVVATTGRFLHICIEMSLKLDNINTIVFDEADRLFELGFGEQLREIVARLPSTRQTLLFSATLPKMLVEFARAGLSDPILIRLDVDWKLPSTLWLGWISVRAELKTAALLLLLDKVLTPQTPQAVVFAATKHHVEYLSLILQKAGISSTYAYSGLDASARKIALGRFTNQKCSVLLVTDVAARGLDLPALDTVINYNFPATPKLFVHRVGRSARAGRAGRAFSLIAADDVAHLLDLQLFLGAELKTPSGAESGSACPSGVWGAVPTSALELRHQDVVTWEKNLSEIEEAVRTCSRGWQQYIKWREPASAEANKRAKLTTTPVLTHPFLVDDVQNAANDLVEQIKNYTPRGIPDGSRVCDSCWIFIQNTLQAQGIISTPPVNTNICVWCKVSLTRRRRHSLPEGPERDEIVQRIHPREIPPGGLVCYACWVAARRNVQRASNRNINIEELLEPGPSHSHYRDVCVWCGISLFRRHTHILTGQERDEVAARIYPSETILELSAKNDSPQYIAMKAKKKLHGKMVQKTRDNKKLMAEGVLVDSLVEKKKKKEVVRDENYIPHQASDQHTEAGMAVNFNSGAAAAELSVGADSGEAARAQRNQLRWDRKRKKMVHVDPDGGRKMIRTESGGRVPATYRSGRYSEWRKRNAAPGHDGDDDDDDDARPDPGRKKPVSDFRPHWVKHNERVAKKKSETSSKEFKNKQQIVKERLRKEKLKQRLKFKSKSKNNKKKRK